MLTGLRKGELASLTVGQLHLDGPSPHLVLRAADDKNRQGSHSPIRRDLVEDLRQWLHDKQSRLVADSGAFAGPLSLRLPPDTSLFTVPAGLVKILDRDLVLAGIARKAKDPMTGKIQIDKRDTRGWTIDVHALRHTFGTLLSRGGCPAADRPGRYAACLD